MSLIYLWDGSISQLIRSALAAPEAFSSHCSSPFAQPLTVIGSSRKTPLPVIKSSITEPFSSPESSNSEEVSFRIKQSGLVSFCLRPAETSEKHQQDFTNV